MDVLRFRPAFAGIAIVICFQLLSSRCSALDMAKMTTLDSPIRDMQWVGPSDEIVFTITESGHLWKSIDGGVSWTDETALGKLPGAHDIPAAHGTYEPPQGVQALLFNELAPNKIFLRGGGDLHWVTTNAGETYTQVHGPAGHLGVQTIRLHPTEPDWILLMARRWSCWSPQEGDKALCADDLFLTKDFGNSWTNITMQSEGRILGFVDFDWGWSKKPEKSRHPATYKKETILASVFENRKDVRDHISANGAGVAAGWDRFVDFVRSDDLFKSSHFKTVDCGNQFEIMNDVLFLAVAAQCSSNNRASIPGSSVKLKISADYGSSFTDACFPYPLPERGYSVVDTSQSSTFVNVDYGRGSQLEPQGDLLVSDSSYSLFSVSLRRNARSILGAVDFSAIQGMPGVYIANQLEQKTSDPMARTTHGGSVDEDEEREYSRSTTVVTFNGGSSWQPLKPPSYDANHSPISCGDTRSCSLHLHGSTSWIAGGGFGFVYSHASTPGLVISTGNVGEFLYQDSTVNTFLSRDAGQSWEEIAKGPHIYEFGDSGGVIVMSRHGLHASTHSLLYSLDEGTSWEEVAFTSPRTPVDVINIRVEPDNQGRKFIAQGLTARDDTGVRLGVLISLDFQAGFRDFKTCSAYDYEDWSPTEKQCFQGQKMKLRRQVRSSKCWNGENYKWPPPATTPCNCTVNDYQCEFGSEVGQDGVCRPQAGVLDASHCPSLSSGRYKLSKDGQRLVAGNKCVNPLPEGKRSLPAPPLPPAAASQGSSSSQPASRSPSSPTPSSNSSGGGGGGGMSWLTAFFLSVFGFGVAAAGVIFAAARGLIPEGLMESIPGLSSLRYWSLRNSFQSLSGGGGYGLDEVDDSEYEEMETRI